MSTNAKLDALGVTTKTSGPRLLATSLLLAYSICSQALAKEELTIDALVRRAQIPLAALSPDGRLAAYLLTRGNPIRNTYEITIRIAETGGKSPPFTLDTYELTPGEAFQHTGAFPSDAGALIWVSGDVLIFTTKAGNKRYLWSWSAGDNRTRSLLKPHDRIAVEVAETPDRVSVSTVDFVDAPSNTAYPVPDLAWRMRDGYRFAATLKNPKLGRWTRTQKWDVSVSAVGGVVDAGPVEISEGWEAEPQEWKRASTAEVDGEVTYSMDETAAPNGKATAIVEFTNSNLRLPESSYASTRLSLKLGATRTPLTERTRPLASQTILGWSADSRLIYYLTEGPEESSLNVVSISGRGKTIFRQAVGLEAPIGKFGRRGSQLVSRDGRVALLVRSTNVMPAELITVNLIGGKVRVVESPNTAFSRSRAPLVQFLPIEAAGGQTWGRLYLPAEYRKGARYPLVITQYLSTAGYYASVGDEVPIVPLTNHGIAVFAMHSGPLNQNSLTGDFRLEISRVQRPLEGMEWIVQKLVADGVVDPCGIGLTGLSYGAEIAMYAMWKSKTFRAISTASSSWDPGRFVLSGLNYASFLEQRGFTLPDESGLPVWRALTAGMNARPDLPPLLLQTPDNEEIFMVPTWFRLRRVGAAVEWYEYPNEGHIKFGPASKWWVYTRNLDWFRFWLQGYEDPDPAKIEQYARWRNLRDKPQ